jgi:hypothetical protein
MKNRVSQLDSKLELLIEELRDVKPASHSFWVLRQCLDVGGNKPACVFLWSVVFNIKCEPDCA